MAYPKDNRATAPAENYWLNDMQWTKRHSWSVDKNPNSKRFMQ